MHGVLGGPPASHPEDVEYVQSLLLLRVQSPRFKPQRSVLRTQAVYTCIVVRTVSLLLFHTRLVSLDSVVTALPMRLFSSASKERLSATVVHEFMDDLQHIAIDVKHVYDT